MSSLALRTSRATAPIDAPTLRLLPRTAETDSPRAAGGRAGLRLAPAAGDQAAPVLVAGRDATQRAAVLAQLVATMPEGTVFRQAGAFWEVLERAPVSRMIVLSGELDELPTESLMHMLGHRHPDLPVVCMDAAAGEA